MKTNNLNITTLLSGVALVAATSAQASVLTTVNGNIDIAANWDAGLAAAGETATVNIDSQWPNTNAASTVSIFGDLVFNGGTLTVPQDLIAGNPTSITFNSVTINVDDDIFSGAGGNYIFNDGSVTNVDDDFEANAGSSITVNGGTHNVGIAVAGGNFGAQRGSTLNFLGGTVVADGFRTTAGNAATPLGGTINIGGDATLTAPSVTFDPSGVVDFSSLWTGSLTIPTDWAATLVGTTATFDGSPIDQTIFDDNFLVEGNTVSLVQIPEPSVALLGAFGLLGLLRRRR